MPDNRRASDAGPCAHVYRDSPQASGCVRDRIPEREERNRHRPTERQGAQLLGRTFLARGYAVSTVGFELEQVRTYIREQDAADGAGGQF